MQLASTLGFILNKRSGKFLGLTPEEQGALHECLTWPGIFPIHHAWLPVMVSGRVCVCAGGGGFPRWLRCPGNNVHCFYGDELENFDTCCRRLMKRIKSIIPDGCPRARIRATSRVTRRLDDAGTLADTLGDEARGMVVVGDCFCPAMVNVCSMLLPFRSSPRNSPLSLVFREKVHPGL